MARSGAVFGGEHSAHYYFREFWFADTGMLAALHVLAALGEQHAPLSSVMARYDRYAASGEINSTVTDQAAAVAAVRAGWVTDAVAVDELDGLTVTHGRDAGDGDGTMWWFNVRASNTEPLLRLNVEAQDEETMHRVRDGVLEIVRGPIPVTTIEPWLREILRCPQCRSALTDEQGPTGPELVCTNASCALAYRIDDGVPVLLVDEARRP